MSMMSSQLWCIRKNTKLRKVNVTNLNCHGRLCVLHLLKMTDADFAVGNWNWSIQIVCCCWFEIVSPRSCDCSRQLIFLVFYVTLQWCFFYEVWQEQLFRFAHFSSPIPFSTKVREHFVSSALSVLPPPASLQWMPQYSQISSALFLVLRLNIINPLRRAVNTICRNRFKLFFCV